jgi:hypothetical protein
MMTADVSALPEEDRARVIEFTRTYDDFMPDNDLHEEHDFHRFSSEDWCVELLS